MKRFTVIGLGKFGRHIAKALFEEGHEVIAVDSDKTRVQAMNSDCNEAIVMDATDKDQLNALGLETMDAVVVTTGTNISSSILICLYLQEIGVKKILAKAIDPDHGKILKKVGATEVVYPEKDMAVRVARGLSTPNIMDFIPLSEDYTLVQVDPPRYFIGKSLKDLDLRAKYGVYLIAVQELVPENFILVPHADFVIKDSDLLMLLGKTEGIKKIKALK
ncbi:MAG: TrkA family potassium uptake protein [Desulfobacteraceae bacterium]|nr:MAG: TrkA family potassium uptake protein [Desulfobacteraceae bacterium]